jgi:hypothetical protein
VVGMASFVALRRGRTSLDPLHSLLTTLYHPSTAPHDQCDRHESARYPGTYWNTQRVGPMTSHGGYDWWQLGWADAGGFMRAGHLNRDGSKEIVIYEHSMLPVDEHGSPLSFPPIHIHHMHVMTSMVWCIIIDLSPQMTLDPNPQPFFAPLHSAMHHCTLAPLHIA